MRPRKPVLLCMACAAVVGLVLTGCGSTGEQTKDTSTAAAALKVDAGLRAMLPAKIRDAGVITVGTPFDNPPSISVQPGGQPTGIAVDLTEKAGEILGVRFTFTQVAFPGVIPGLQSGKFDVSVGMIGDSPDRQKLLDFVDITGAENNVLVRKGDAEKIAGLPDLCGKKIAAIAGGVQLPIINANSAKCPVSGGTITIQQYSSVQDALSQLASGRVDGFMVPYLTGVHVAKTAGGGATFAVAKTTYQTGVPAAIGLAKDEGDFAKALQGALRALIANGTYGQIMKKYDATPVALPAQRVAINGAGTASFPVDS